MDMSASLFPEVVSDIDANPEHKRLNLYTRALYCFFVVRHVGKSKARACHDVTSGIWASVFYRERTMRARTDTILYEYSSVNNGRYRYEYSLCHGVLATYIIRPGRSLRGCCLYAMGGKLHPRLKYADHQQQTNLCTRSVLRLVDW